MSSLQFDDLVGRYYRDLYRFAFSLTHAEAEACDLTQQTFYIWATKGHQLQDESKVKTWLFTALHREFLKTRRHQTRFPHNELQEMEKELPPILPVSVDQMDSAIVLEALMNLDESYRAPIALFYLQDHSYREIAEILDLPIGTVQSRIARGKARLQDLLADAKEQPRPGAPAPETSEAEEASG